MPRPAVVLFATATACVFLGRVLAPEFALYAVLTDFVLRGIAGVLAVSITAFGARQAWRAAHLFGDGNAARAPWRLFALWLSAFCAGQVTFSIYQLIVRSPTPLPSVADAFLLSGYIAMISGLVLFRRTFSRSGMAVGHPTALGVLAVFLTLLVVVSAAMGRTLLEPQPAIHRFVNGAYPALDVVALTALFVVFKTVRPLNGGRVFVVWASLVASILLACVGDVLFAHFFLHGFGRFESLVNLVYTWSYTAAAHGAWAQRRILERTA